MGVLTWVTYFAPQIQELMKGSTKLHLFDLKKLNASLLVPSIPKNSGGFLVMDARDGFIVVSN